MDARRGDNGVVPGHGQDFLRTFRVNQVRRAENGPESGPEGPPDDLIPVGIEFFHVEMGVGVHQAGCAGEFPGIDHLIQPVMSGPVEKKSPEGTRPPGLGISS